MMRLRWELKVFLFSTCFIFTQNLFALGQVSSASLAPTVSMPIVSTSTTPNTTPSAAASNTSTEAVTSSTASTSTTPKTPSAAASNTSTEAVSSSTASTPRVAGTKSSQATNSLGAKLLDNAGAQGSYYPRVTVRDLTAGQREVSVVIANAKGDLQATVVRVDPQGNVVRLLLKKPMGSQTMDVSIISQDGAVKVVDTPNVVIGSDGVLVDAPEDK